jgi:hypothetical protein
VTPLATPEQLAARMTATATPERVDAALTDASATVRSYTGQHFTRAVTTDTLASHCCAQVRLPQRPVQEVLDVLVGDVVATWRFNGTDRVDITWPRAGAWYAAVTYDHGYDEIPDDIVAVVCNVAARSLASPPERAGMTQQSITNYSESFGSVGASGPVGLFADEQAILSRYRRSGGMARMC